MTTQILTQPCDCGCQPCECCAPETCCALDCIERPRFFCGQLLTDHDLQDLVHWSRDKFALQRYRTGWGVACGLRLSCVPGERTKLRLSPGYAVDCCGNDIVVCEEICLDLADLCLDKEDPCAKWRSGKDAEERDKQEIRIADIIIHYAEQDGSPQTALGRNHCYEAVDCEPSRVKETYRLSWNELPTNTLPGKEHFRRWLEGYKTCSKVYRAFLEAFGNPDVISADQMESFKHWLLGMLRKHPLQRYCFVERHICQAAEMAIRNPDFNLDMWELRQIFFWIELDCRIAYVARDCHSCAESEGIHLGRVIMEDSEEGCCLLAVLDQPPYRRNLTPEALPAEQGCRNLGDLIGVTRGEACETLQDWGIRHQFVEVNLERQGDDNQNRTRFEFQDRLWACCDDQIIVYTVPNLLNKDTAIVCDFGVAKEGAIPIKENPRPIDVEPVPVDPVEEQPERRPASAEDLQFLDGIGPAKHERLKASNINNFLQFAQANPQQLERLLNMSAAAVLELQQVAKRLVEEGFGS